MRGVCFFYVYIYHRLQAMVTACGYIHRQREFSLHESEHLNIIITTIIVRSAFIIMIRKKRRPLLIRSYNIICSLSVVYYLKYKTIVSGAEAWFALSFFVCQEPCEVMTGL